MKKSSSSRRGQRRKEPRTTRTLRERLPLVRQALKENKPRRQIARELVCDEGTVRHDIRILQLPEELVNRIENGEPAEPFLQKARIAAAREEQQRRLQEEAETGKHSDNVAKDSLAWLMTKPLIRADEEKIVGKVDHRLWLVRDVAAAPRRDALKTFAHNDYSKLFAKTQDQIEACTNVLSHALILLAPERQIRVQRHCEDCYGRAAAESEAGPNKTLGAHVYCHRSAPTLLRKVPARSRQARQTRPRAVRPCFLKTRR